MRPIAILGAGLAGLSLADALRERGVTRPLVLVDRRTGFERDRTWCTWETEAGRPLRFAELADHRWWSWRVRRRGAEVVARTRRHPYIHLDAATVYDAALERLDGDPRVALRLGERVVSVHAGARHPRVTTTRESFDAELVVDAMGATSPLLRGRPAGEVELTQRFLGWEVRVDRPVFDSATATLMDFLAPEPDSNDDGDCAFLYVLPFAADRALVEHTTIGPGGGPRADRRRATLQEALDAWGVRDHERLREERGLIGMSSHRFAAVHAPGVLAAGAAAGAVRPSSGYAFTRTMRHVEALADAIAAGTPPPATLAAERQHRLDTIFLRALATAEDHGEALLWTIAGSVDGDAFARFMTDVATARDEARVIAALPAGRMLRVALNGPW